jgi:hypothetical protein
MRWLFFIALYLIGIPATVYAAKGASPFYFTIILLFGYSIAFVIGMGFRKRKNSHRENRLIYND